MKDAVMNHISSVSMVIALLLLLATIVALSTSKASASDGPAIIGLVSAVSTITGAIAGKQLSGGKADSTNGNGKVVSPATTGTEG